MVRLFFPFGNDDLMLSTNLLYGVQFTQEYLLINHAR